MKIHTLTFEAAHASVNYNPLTGIFTWRRSQGKAREGSVLSTVQAGYGKTTINKEQIRLHRLAWFMTHGVWPSGQIDHIDGNKLNNRIANLRDVPMSINMQNRYSTKTKASGLPYGVCHAHGGKFMANIRVGIFDTAEEASAAYMKAKRLIHKGCTR